MGCDRTHSPIKKNAKFDEEGKLLFEIGLVAADGEIIVVDFPTGVLTLG